MTLRGNFWRKWADKKCTILAWGFLFKPLAEDPFICLWSWIRLPPTERLTQSRCPCSNIHDHERRLWNTKRQPLKPRGEGRRAQLDRSYGQARAGVERRSPVSPPSDSSDADTPRTSHSCWAPCFSVSLAPTPTHRKEPPGVTRIKASLEFSWDDAASSCGGIVIPMNKTAIYFHINHIKLLNTQVYNIQAIGIYFLIFPSNNSTYYATMTNNINIENKTNNGS